MPSLAAPRVRSALGHQGGNVIEQVIERWHAFVRGETTEGLEELLAEDVQFFSPIVFTPQRGKDITALYLLAASQTLGKGGFRYTKELVSGDLAMLEFETTLDRKHVNGIDIIRIDEAGLIVEFRVMIRPLQAVNAVHAAMGAMLASLQ
jgi:ketosteroid isomerase-like protein